MLDATALRSLSAARLEDARVLYGNGRYDGATYICGYAVELVLKARICDTLDVTDYPEHLPGFKIHKLNTLLLLSGREIQITSNHRITWNLATAKWDPDLRYRAVNTISAQEAQTMIRETANLLPLL